MNVGTGGWRATTGVLLALGTGACGSDVSNDGGRAGAPQTAGSAGASAGGSAQGGASQNAGGDSGAAGTGGDISVLGPTADCTFELTTSGAQVVSYAPNPLGCSTLGSDSLYAIFVNEAGWQTEFRAPDFKEGQTAVLLPASFQIGVPLVSGWQIADGGCTVEVTEQLLLGPAPPAYMRGAGRQYRLTGHGDCSAPAKDPQGAMADIIPGPFSFRARKSFYD